MAGLQLVNDLSVDDLYRKMNQTYSPEEINELKALIDEAEVAEDTRFQHPFTMLVAGPSQSGKSCLVKKILENDVINPPPEKIIWCYSEWQPLYDELTGRVDDFVEGLEFEEHLDGRPTLLVIDDLQDEVSNDATVANLFKRGSHHKDISVIFIVQNLFFQGKKCRDISTNAHYVILFNNPADRLQVNKFAQRIGNFDFVMKTYKDVCQNRPHGYLIFDFTQGSSERIRFRTGIPTEQLFMCKK